MRVADWIGFTVYVFFGALTLMQASSVTVLLLPTVAYELFIAAAFLMRAPVRAALPDLRARLVAHAGTFFMVVSMWLVRRVNPEWLASSDRHGFVATGWTMWLLGGVFVFWSIWYLRHSFSIEPQARRLITSGPYSLARHPVYTGYLLQYIGMWMIIPTLPLAVLIIIWVAIMRQRMLYEEQVLSSAFPEYHEYRRHVGALWSVPMRRPNAKLLRSLETVKATEV
jgi:protein-S-isoprenylcysteine O-methyltransferase Ste14